MEREFLAAAHAWHAEQQVFYPHRAKAYLELDRSHPLSVGESRRIPVGRSDWMNYTKKILTGLLTRPNIRTK